MFIIYCPKPEKCDKTFLGDCTILQEYLQLGRAALREFLLDLVRSKPHEAVVLLC